MNDKKISGTMNASKAKKIINNKTRRSAEDNYYR